MSENILEVRNLNKHFGPTYANKNISFTVKKGEIHGLAGENGSGKSTLLSQIAGMQKPDSGEMFVNGQPYAPASTIEAYDHKISMVLQELGVVGNLSVGLNIFLGRTSHFTKFGFFKKKALEKAAREECEKWQLPVPPLNRLSGTMMIEERKMTELVRALSIDPDVLLLDEVTQSLSLNNRKILYDLMERLKAMGKSIIIITHDLEEMMEITDSITILRDGEVIGTVDTKESDIDQIKRMMVGRDLGGHYYREDQHASYSDEVVLRVNNMTVKNEIEDVSFEVHAGEILGFCGLSDSGIHTVGQAVYGLAKVTSGDVELTDGSGDESKSLKITSPTQALRNRMGYVPKDRDTEALMINASIRENISLPSYKEMSTGIGYVSPVKMKDLTNKMIDQFSVKCTGPMQSMNALSGGNKQKINLGRWLAKDIRLLVLDCPTRGVDIGVKSYIYSVMEEAKKKNIAVLLISDELAEVIGMSDRLVVMKDGKIVKTMLRDEGFTAESIGEVMI